jgi:hypothetical protein
MEGLLEFYRADKFGNIYGLRFGRKIKCSHKPNGYLKFNAYVPGCPPRTVYAHRFVWFFHFGEIKKKLVVNHKNFNKSDNRVSNLEVIRRQENVNHAVNGGRFENNGAHTKGTGNGRSKLTEKKVLEISRRLALGERVCDLSREYDVGATAISDIKTKKSWGHLWVGQVQEGKDIHGKDR